VAKKPAQPLFDARGRLLLERRGLPREMGSTLSGDAYHFLRTASWTRITLLFGALFLVVNLAFAVLLWAAGANVVGSHGLADDFWFSVQTVATIGYGVLSPGDTFTNVIVTVESFVGIALTALVTGVVFSRFATASARAIFSKVAIIADYDGDRVLTFRCANARATAIVEATIRVYLSRDEKLKNGDAVRRIYELVLRRNTTPIFNASWSVYHDIDAKSPLANLTAEDLAASSTIVIVTFQGIDDRLAQTVHTRYAYNAEDIVFDRKFVDIFKRDEATGRRYLDFEPFHDHVETTAS
jgi:inward rectifier potassium channel